MSASQSQLHATDQQVQFRKVVSKLRDCRIVFYEVLPKLCRPAQVLKDCLGVGWHRRPVMQARVAEEDASQPTVQFVVVGALVEQLFGQLDARRQRRSRLVVGVECVVDVGRAKKLAAKSASSRRFSGC